MIGEYGSYESWHGLVVLPDGSGVTAMLSPSGNGIWDNCTLSGEVVVAAESIRDEFETWNFEANLTYRPKIQRHEHEGLNESIWRGNVARNGRLRGKRGDIGSHRLVQRVLC